MKKRNIFFSLILCIFAFSMVFVAGCTTPNDPPANPPSNQTTPKASITAVADAVADKMSQTVSALANVSNGQVAEEGESGALGAGVVGQGWEKATLGDFLNIQEYPSMMIYIVEYCLRNATKENGYANGFELNHVYFGVADVGYEGVIYFSLDEVENGVTLKADLHFEYSSVELQYAVNGFFGYDYENNKVNSIQLNYAILPIGRELLTITIDYENNSFYGFNAYFPQEMSMTLGTEFVEEFNAGTLTLDKVADFGFEEIVMVSGNLSDNVNDFIFDGYTYDLSHSEKSQPTIILKAYFTGVLTPKGWRTSSAVFAASVPCILRR